MRLTMILPAALLLAIVGALFTVQHAARARLPLLHTTTEVVAVPIAGGRPHTILRLPGQYSAPAGTPDGALLLVHDSAVWRFVDGRGTRVGPLPAGMEPLWSPDRSRYLTWERARIVVHRLDGSVVRTLTEQPGIGGITCTTWRGTSITCVRLTNPKSGWRSDLEVWREDGTLLRTRRLAHPFGTPSAPLRTPDGKTTVFVDRQGRLRANGQTLVERPEGEIGLSADGRTVYVARVKVATSIPK